MGSVRISVRHSDLLHFKKIQLGANGPGQLVYGICFDVGCHLESQRAPKCYSSLCCSAEFAGSFYWFLYLCKNISK